MPLVGGFASQLDFFSPFHVISKSRCFIILFKDYVHGTQSLTDDAPRETLLRLLVSSFTEATVVFDSFGSEVP